MSAKPLTLRAWIEEMGVSRVAQTLGVTRSAVGHWKRGYVLPDSRQLQAIRRLSKGRVSMDRSLDEHFDSKNKKRYARTSKKFSKSQKARR